MNLTTHPNNFPIVGIGASAGGLSAFKRFLEAIPEDSGMAYVLVQHLDPTHESMLPELLSRSTRIPVLEITDQIKIFPDTIYIIPENKMLTANDGALQLTPRDVSKLNLPIDLFFRSLADVHKTYAVGVILSGSASDGTEGLKAIKEAGGITFAQDLDSADFPSMPLSAINAEVVDFVLPPESIPLHILKVKKLYELNHGNIESDDIPAEDDDLYKRLIALLRSRTGHDFSNYKQATIRRRIARRMVATETHELNQYYNFVRHSKKEQDALFNDVLIPVTYFFRDHKIFQELDNTVFPAILTNKTKQEPVRVWIAGCASGEEAYSLAICLHEFFSEKMPNARIQVFASDISEHVIAKARLGIYNRQDMKMISPQHLAEYFVKNGNDYQVSSIIRDMCVFAVHNFLKDPPFAKMDLISCRNVLIYMNVLFQKKALTNFHYALNAGGILWLGKSESVSTAADLFTPFNKQYKWYTRATGPGSYMRVSMAKVEDEVFSSKSNIVIKNEPRNEFLKSAEGILFSKYTPPAVIINAQMDIVHFHGDLSKILLPPRGKPSLNVLKMARHELVFELRNIFHKCKKSGESTTSDKIPISFNDELFLISQEIIPLVAMDEEHYLLVFTHTHVVSEIPDKSGSTQKLKNTKSQDRIKELETELLQLRENIRSVTEDQEIFNEELQSANEELLSSSEELQSVNEELETSKEELQASNEELIGLNQELIDRQEQLVVARNYSQAIVSSINSPIVILDKTLRIRSANKSFFTFFDTTDVLTQGKQVFELNAQRWDMPEFRSLLENIIPGKSQFTDYETIVASPSLGERVMLLSAKQLVHEKATEDFVLLVMQDVTDSKTAEALRQSEERFRLATELTGLGTWELNLATNRIFNSSNTRKIMGITEAESGLEEFLQKVHRDDQQKATGCFSSAATKGSLFCEVRLDGTDGQHRWIRVSGKAISNASNQSTRLLGTVMDISEQKTYLLQLEESEERFKAIADSAPVLLWMAEATDAVNFYNKGWLEFTGLTLEQAVKSGWSDAIHPEDLAEMKHIYEVTFEARKEFFMEFRLKRNDGIYRWISFHGAPRFAIDGNFQGYVGGGIDINDQKAFADTLEVQVQERTEELKRSHESLQERNQQLERSNNELASFSFVASHDLQEPLRRIRAFSDRILENEKHTLSPTSSDYFSRMNKAAKQMTQLIHDLLDYSQVNPPQAVEEFTDLNEVVDNVLSSLNIVLEEKNAKVEVSALPKVKVLPSQLLSIFRNLVTNAIKYSKPGVPPLIKISSTSVDGQNIDLPELRKDTSYWKIMVVDNGIGFDPKYNQQIFEMFQRLHAKTEYEGTGIGLAICKKIIQNNQGTITATSEPGKGSTFEIYLPKEI
ncbi:MAG: chemotaxis protein CheB [Bacteroidota bacterium]